MPFHKTQTLNEWVVMLVAIYTGSQNYAKTPYEIHARLTEVCGVFAKRLFKRRDSIEAGKFVPKIFAWSVALLKKVRPDQASLEDIILRKFPNFCPYCLKKPCQPAGLASLGYPARSDKLTMPCRGRAKSAAAEHHVSFTASDAVFARQSQS